MSSPTAPAPPAPVPVAQEVQKPTLPPAEPKSTLHELLNVIKCDNIVLASGIPLGDALFRIFTALGRTGVAFDEVQQPKAIKKKA